jgi:molybdate transport system substrate-binding protein
MTLKNNNSALPIVLFPCVLPCVLPLLLISLFFVSSLASFTSYAADIESKATKESIKSNTPLRIAVAANFTPVLKKLLIRFEATTGIKSQVISGASGAMYLQLKHGAPFDIFLSADRRRPEALEQENLILNNSRKTYAIGQLALYDSLLSQEDFNLTYSPEVALQKIPKYFAIANPTISPYGKAAQETLQHLQLWGQYEKRLIKGINISQTFAQIRSKSVSSGLVSQSQLVLNNLKGLVIPSHFHEPITQQLVILKNSKNIKKAQQLSRFLLLPSTQQVIINYGYTTSEVKG